MLFYKDYGLLITKNLAIKLIKFKIILIVIRIT